MEDLIFGVFIVAYIFWAWFIARSSSWFYALLTSILWGPALHGHVSLNIEPLMAIGTVPISEFIGDWIIQILFFNAGGVLLAVCYVWPVWGLNRAKWLALLLSMWPTVFVLPFFIPQIIVFHVVDLLIIGPVRGETIWSTLNHRGKSKSDYALDS